MNEEFDIDPKPITPEEVANWMHEYRKITRCPAGKSFKMHLQELMNELNKYLNS